jgi:hypothetical protein
MALFSSARDASLVRNFSRELMQKMITIEVAYYKLSLNDTAINLYGESNKKTYFNPIRLYSLIRKEDKVSADDDIGINYTKSISFAFLRDDLKDNGILLSPGDIVGFDSGFYEIDNVRGNQYWMGRNPDTLIAFVERDINEFGYSVSIIAETHMSKLSGLQLVETRSGINTIKTTNQQIMKGF